MRHHAAISLDWLSPTAEVIRPSAVVRMGCARVRTDLVQPRQGGAVAERGAETEKGAMELA
ncbi:hypothetical protein ADL03_21000 [Nocardia sp. NRRL S-836]|nr:hypothetical protein ADL03_21000 [Nocardia sp. NRRL S-836]